VPATAVTGLEDLRAQLKTAPSGPRLIQVDTHPTTPE
jgi:benzoylformate decarboxylase